MSTLNKTWSLTAQDCYALQGECSLCAVPALKLELLNAPPDGRSCWAWHAVQNLIEKQKQAQQEPSEKLNPSHLMVLRALKITGDSTVTQISKQIYRSRTFVYQQLHALRGKNLVTSYHSETTGRELVWTIVKEDSALI